MTTYGALRIIPSSDIGELGPAQGQALVYKWKWYYGTQEWLVWLALVLALVIPQANRDRRALLILVPLAMTSLVWFLLKAALRIPSSVAYEYGMMIDCLVVGLAVLWLLAPGLCRFRGGARFFVSLGLIYAVACLGALSSAFSSPAPTLIFLIFPIVPVLLAALLLTTLTATAHRCRGDCNPVRFMLRLGLWTTIGGAVVVFGYFILVTCFLSSGPHLSAIANIAPQVGLAGLVLGMFLYLLNLPFMILGFVSPFFRDRLQRCLGLQDGALAGRWEVKKEGG